MPDVANFQEYTELKDHLASVGETADPANVAEANAALLRYEQKYSLPSISDGPSLLAPDTGPRERGASYEPPVRQGAKAASKVAQAVPQLSEGAERGITDPPIATPPASSLAQPPVRMIQKPGVGQLGATVQQMPSHVGGGTDILPDPPVSKFVSEVAPTLQGKMDALSFAAMMEEPEASPQFRQWLDEEWNSRSDLALARGHSAKRIPAGLLDPSYVKDAPWEDRLEEGANRSLDALSGGSAAALNVGGLGAGTALAGAVGGENAAKSIQESERRHPVIGAAAGLKGASSPLSPGSLAARGINRGLLAAGAKVAPKLTGVAPFIGRAAAAGVAGGVSNAAEGAGRDLIEGAATGDGSGTTVGAALQRGLMGSALGSAFHIAGEGFGKLDEWTEKAYEAELRDAGRVGAEPGLGGVKLAPGSPVQELETARVAQELPSGAGVAAGRVAPKIADEGAAIKAREIEQAKTETGQAYDRLARGKPPSDPGIEEPLPRYPLDSEPLPRFEAEAGRPTLPPGAGDAEADAFGRIAQEQGESQASLLGVQQAAQRGAHVTPDPVTVSTAPVVEKVLDIIRKHNPADGELPFLPSDNVLREHLPKMAKMQYMPLDRAKSVLARSGKGWIQPAEDGPKLGLGTGGEGDVLLVIPRKMDAPSFDSMVQALDDRANFTGELKKGDPRFQELSAVAHETRAGFPGLNELKRKQTEGFTATDTTLKHAGVRVGQGGKAKGWTEGGADQQRSVENAVKQFKQQGDRLTDDALRTVAKLGGFESELNQIPGQIAVEKLEKTMRTGENIPASDAGVARRAYQVGRLHLYPHIKALGDTPAPEKELQAMAEALSPQLKRALRAMRVGPVVKPRVQDISGLTSRIGLKGGVMGQRVAASAEESGLTEEDVTNLQRLKKAVGAN